MGKPPRSWPVLQALTRLDLYGADSSVMDSESAANGVTGVDHLIFLALSACCWLLFCGRDSTEDSGPYMTPREEDGTMTLVRKLQHEVCELQQKLMETEEENTSLKGMMDKWTDRSSEWCRQQIAMRDTQGPAGQFKLNGAAPKLRALSPPVLHRAASSLELQQQVCEMQQEIFESRRIKDEYSTLKAEHLELTGFKQEAASNVDELEALLKLYQVAAGDHELSREQLQDKNEAITAENVGLKAQLTRHGISQRTPKVPSDYPKKSSLSHSPVVTLAASRSGGLHKGALATRNIPSSSPKLSVGVTKVIPSGSKASERSPTQQTRAERNMQISKQLVVATEQSKMQKLATELQSLEKLQQQLDQLERVKNSARNPPTPV